MMHRDMAIMLSVLIVSSSACFIAHLKYCLLEEINDRGQERKLIGAMAALFHPSGNIQVKVGSLHSLEETMSDGGDQGKMG